MTTHARHADPSPDTDTAMDKTEPAPDGRATIGQAAGELARSLPPMTAVQAALVRRTLRDQRR